MKAKQYKRKYNYVYIVTNHINDKVYIGVHKTDNLDDGYMGSGLALQRAYKKYGIENFEKEILAFCDTYKDALDLEGKLVNKDFVLREDTYNLHIGGVHWEGGSKSLFEKMSNAQKLRFKDKKAREYISKNFKESWNNPEYRKMMDEKVYSNAERNRKISEGRSKWAKDNPEENKKLMDKINHNPEKIRKMAETHTGMKRSDSAKKNISKGISDYYKNSEDGGAARSGKGCMYIHNPESGEAKRVPKDVPIPSGWKRGMGKRK
jgi:hypothetical protein